MRTDLTGSDRPHDIVKLRPKCISHLLSLIGTKERIAGSAYVPIALADSHGKISCTCEDRSGKHIGLMIFSTAVVIVSHMKTINAPRANVFDTAP
jgi:hypothetical protein